MIGRSRYWFLVLWVGVFAVLALPGRAEAQATTSSCSIAMSSQLPVIRVNDTSGRQSSSTDTTLKLTITRADCADPELKYKFALAITGYTVGWQVQAWAGRNGSNCSGEFAGADNLKTCWKLGDLAVTNMSATAEYTPSQILGVDPAQLYGNSKRILTSCDDMTNNDAGRQQFNVYFFITYSNVVQCERTQQMFYSLKGPDAPDITSVNAADSSLQVSWESIAATLTTEVTYEFYCARNESEGGGCSSSKLEAFGAKPAGSSTASAGAGGTSGEGGASSTAGTSSEAGTAGSLSSAGDSGVSSAGAAGDSGVSSAGAAGDAAVAAAGGDTSSFAVSTETGGSAGASSTTTGKLSDLHCGSVRGKINTSGYTDSVLSNSHSYAITIGVRDTYGNLGNLTPYWCEHPEPIDTFFEGYNNAGGKAGGGFCNLDVRPKHGALPAAFGAIGLLAWLRRRRQAPRHRGSSDASTH